MKRNVLIGLVVLLLGAAVAITLWSREPEFHGRTLNSWLGDLDYGLSGFDRSQVPKAEEAVREIGARGVPTLISMMRYRDSSLRVRVRKLLSKQKLVKIKEPLSAQHVQWRGARGVWILGQDATAAIPDLIPLLTNQSSWVRSSAAMALGKIGTNAAGTVPHLVKSLDDPNPDVRNCSAIALQSIGPAARLAMPVLLRHLDDPDPETRSLMTWTFLSITNDRSMVMPYLLRHLGDPKADARGRAVAMLRSFGSDAQSALPELMGLLNDPNKDVRRAATNAVSTIEGKTGVSVPGRATPFRFVNVSCKELLDFYGSLTGKRIEMAPDIQRFTKVTITPYDIMTLDEGIRLIEEELGEQANLVLTPSTNGVIFVKYKQAGHK